MIKAPSKPGIEGNIFHLISTICNKPRANTVLTGEILSASTSIRYKANTSSVSTPFQYVLAILTNIMKQER